ncbi:MAG: hemerythrin domain-containing protein [Nanoarchaeota archaeon]
MTSEIIKILSDEHKNILIVVDVLSNQCRKMSGNEIDKDFFLGVIDFIRNYADKFHHAKEEDLLFKEFCKNAEKGDIHCNPVDQMLYEHDIGRGFVKQMEEGVKENNQRKIIEGANGYASLIREHIFKEDNILYPMTDESLDEKTKQKMLWQFKEIERKKKKEQEKYLNFVRTIK